MVSMNYHQHSDCSQCIDQWWGWVKKQPVPPLKGFRDKKNPDGSKFSYQQQILATKMQLYFIIDDLCKRGKSSDTIQSIITAFF